MSGETEVTPELMKRIAEMRAALQPTTPYRGSKGVMKRPWRYGQCLLVRSGNCEDEYVVRHREVARMAVNLIEDLMTVIETQQAVQFSDANEWLVRAAGETP